MSDMENEIKKLIEKWNQCKSKGYFEGLNGEGLSNEIIEDLQSLLKFKQENCCQNFVVEEVTHKQIESAVYNRGHHDGYMQAKNEEYK